MTSADASGVFVTTDAEPDEIVSPPLREPVNSRPATKGRTLQRPPIVLPEEPDGCRHGHVGATSVDFDGLGEEIDALLVDRDAQRARADEAEAIIAEARSALAYHADVGAIPEFYFQELASALEMDGLPKMPKCDYCKGAILPGARVHVEGGRAWHGCQAHAPSAHAHPLDDWSDAAGIVCWWTELEPKVQYLGTPLDDDFPDHVTHWTPVVNPSGFETAGAP